MIKHEVDNTSLEVKEILVVKATENISCLMFPQIQKLSTFMVM